MPHDIDRDHAIKVARWALPVIGTIDGVPTIDGGVQLHITGASARTRAATALRTAGYVVTEQPPLLRVTAWHPQKVDALHEVGINLVLACPLCQHWFTIHAAAAGGISDCPSCPWRGIVGNALAMPGTPGGGPRW